MSDMQAAQGRLRLLPSEGSTRWEKAVWINEHANHIAQFEEFDDSLEEAWGPDLMFLNGEWYQVVEHIELDAYGFDIASEDPSTGDILYTCLWYNGGASEEEVVEAAIKEHLNKSTVK